MDQKQTYDYPCHLHPDTEAYLERARSMGLDEDDVYRRMSHADTRCRCQTTLIPAEIEALHQAACEVSKPEKPRIQLRTWIGHWLRSLLTSLLIMIGLAMLIVEPGAPEYFWEAVACQVGGLLLLLVTLWKAGAFDHNHH